MRSQFSSNCLSFLLKKLYFIRLPSILILVRSYRSSFFIILFFLFIFLISSLYSLLLLSSSSFFSSSTTAFVTIPQRSHLPQHKICVPTKDAAIYRSQIYFDQDPKRGLKIGMPTDALLIFTSKFIDKKCTQKWTEKTMLRGRRKEKGCAILGFNSRHCKVRQA